MSGEFLVVIFVAIVVWIALGYLWRDKKRGTPIVTPATIHLVVNTAAIWVKLSEEANPIKIFLAGVAENRPYPDDNDISAWLEKELPIGKKVWLVTSYPDKVSTYERVLMWSTPVTAEGEFNADELINATIVREGVARNLANISDDLRAFIPEVNFTYLQDKAIAEGRGIWKKFRQKVRCRNSEKFSAREWLTLAAEFENLDDATVLTLGRVPVFDPKVAQAILDETEG